MINGVCVKSQRSTWMVPVVGTSLENKAALGNSLLLLGAWQLFFY